MLCRAAWLVMAPWPSSRVSPARHAASESLLLGRVVWVYTEWPARRVYPALHTALAGRPREKRILPRSWPAGRAAKENPPTALGGRAGPRPGRGPERPAGQLALEIVKSFKTLCYSAFLGFLTTQKGVARKG